MKYQRNCKICNCEDWLRESFVYAMYIEKKSYEQIIEMFERHGIYLNIYNVSIHKHRHVEQGDLKKAEETKARWQAIDAKLSQRSV